MRDRGRLRGASLAAWTLVALAVVLLGARGMVLADDRDDARDDRQFGSEAGQTLTQLTQDLNDAAVEIDAASALAPLDANSDTLEVVANATESGHVRGLLVATRDGAGFVVAATTIDEPPYAAGTQLPDSVGREVAASADLGTARATTFAAGGDGPAQLLVSVPRYEPGSQPMGTAARRASLRNVVVGVIDLDTLVSRAARPLDDAAVRVSDGATPLVNQPASMLEEAPDNAVNQTIVFRGQTLGFTAWSTDDQSTATRWWILAAGGLVAVAVLTTASRERHLASRAHEAAEARAAQLRLVAEVSRRIQGTLETSEILPAVAVALVEHLDLEQVAVALADESGSLETIFSFGDQAANDLPRLAIDLPPAPTGTGASEPFVIPLQRAGRNIGALALRSRRELHAHETESAGMAAELLGAALSSARAYEREEESTQRLMELDQAKTEFLATVSHELRTPLTAVLGFASILSSHWDNLAAAERRDYVDRIARNSANLGTLVHTLLDFSRLERRQLRVSIEPMDLAEAVRDHTERMAMVLDEHRLTVDLPPHAFVEADPEAVERVLVNLLTNAGKYSPPASTILVSVHPRDTEVELRVDDEGPGVDPAERTSIFRRFYRGRSAVAHRTRGAGIGLAVVKEFADSLNGRVWVEDRPGGGARFRVTLPAAEIPLDDLSEPVRALGAEGGNR